MATAIIDGSNIDTSVFSYSAPKANPSGGKVVNLYNKYSKEYLTIATPLLLTWGAQEWMDQAKNPTGKFTINFFEYCKLLLAIHMSEKETSRYCSQI